MVRCLLCLRLCSQRTWRCKTNKNIFRGADLKGRVVMVRLLGVVVGALGVVASVDGALRTGQLDGDALGRLGPLGEREWTMLKRPGFSHGKDAYAHPKGEIFRMFEEFQGLFDKVWNATEQSGKMGDISRERHISHHMLEMRDGVKLSTIIIRPTLKEGDKRAAMLSRSPYGPTSDQVASLFMATNGMVAVIQDQRGTFLSEGEFSMWQHDGADGADTMAWIAEQPWSNGEVYASGVSADGCGAFTQVIEHPKQLKGQFLMLASANAHETIYPGGAYRQGLVDGWMSAMSIMTGGKSLTHTLPEIVKHEALSSYYDTVEIDKYLGNVDWPTVHLTAWWDIFVGHQVKAFDGLVKNSQPSVRDKHVIFIGPYGHCELFNAERPNVSLFEAVGWINAFGYASDLFAGETQGRFQKHAKRINLFVQGLYEHDGLSKDKHVGNYWSSIDAWPKVETHKLFLSKDHRLKMVSESELANGASAGVQAGDDMYQYSPVNPKETHGGNNLILAMIGHGCGPKDQRRNEKRSDVIVFTTDAPLTEPLAITGKITAELYVSSNRKDTDFTVALTDVYPDGRYHKSMLVRYGITRMKWRDGPSKEAAPMEDNHIYKISVDLWPTSYVFNVGHKIRVTISSSNAPYYRRNDNLDDPLDDDIINEKSARNAIHFSDEFPSHVVLPVVDLADLPPNPHL